MARRRIVVGETGAVPVRPDDPQAVATVSASVPYQLSIPPTSEVPPFPPVHVRGARWRPGRAGRRRHRPAVAA
ncbi:hypothetical protein OKJ99_04495, partial [Streptomyces endophyticus]|nr:hypothetical protein [Streptomyces endophyticus]